MNHWDELLNAGRLLHSAGSLAYFALAVAGLLVLFLGSHLSRPASGLVAATAFWLVAHTTLAQSFLPPQARTAFALAAMCAGFFLFGLMFPLSAVLMASGLLGVEAGLRIAGSLGGDPRLGVILVSFAFVVLAGSAHRWMRSVVPAAVGAGAVTFSAFMHVATLPGMPEAARLPLTWLAAWLALASIGFGWDRLRVRWMKNLRHRRAIARDAEARRIREEQDRARYARYMS